MKYNIYSAFLLVFGFMNLILSFMSFLTDTLFFLSTSFLGIDYQIQGDWISFSFLFLVSLISSQVIKYSTYYMEGEVFYTRFCYLVLLFVFSMMLLIISSDGLSLLLGWDGLGITSYALIMFYSNAKSSSSAMVTALSNRVGDIFILWGLGMSFYLGSWDYLYFGFEGGMAFVMLLLASLTKSAQMPFSAWLPAAMAAPTPVSSLVHSSTLVTAGVYLMVRLSPIFLSSGSYILLVLGSVTALFSGLVALGEYDFKRIIALSTLSQLGVMMFSLGLGYPILCYFHLFTHALFKALLFMCSGVVIHASGGIQDIRRLGGVLSMLPYSSFVLSAASCSLMGFPFLAGFYSKDLIIESSEMNSMLFPSFMIIVAALFTCYYSFRLVSISISSTIHNFTHFTKGESGYYLIPLSVLYWGAILGGYLFYWFYLGMESVLVGSLEKSILLSFLTLGIFLGLFIDLKSYSFFSFLNFMGYLPALTGKLSSPLLQSAETIFVHGDQGWVEYFGPNVAFNLSSYLSSLLSSLTNSSYKIFILISYLVMMMM
uniref:NADH-ubiquinone oxidoreductase chain 5 n=1 Tax=Streptocephalus sirindhornae TaxID=91588 RepID=A0A0U1ZA48_9CRUS|nr:NADH dehydrogenase subunit 5 [Streptocephalus sirindhornae]AJP09641.1 NADH dehydrogenase subunit 5 [Streptocephalus sirindhornae]